MIAIIVAGGRGERLGHLTKDIPKSIIKIGGRPVIQHQIDLLRKYGITDIYILIGYLGHLIKECLGDGKTFGVNIKYLQEVRPLGTSGSVKGLEEEITDDFFVLYDLSCC